MQAELVEVAAALEALHPALDHDEAEAAVGLARVGPHRGDDEVGVDAVGDERLGAVDDVVVAVALRAGGDPGEIRAGARLGHRHRGDELAGGDPGQPALALLLVAVAQEVGQADVVVQRDAEPEAADACSLALLAMTRLKRKSVTPAPP